jgi:predicted phosphodiesterase
MHKAHPKFFNVLHEFINLENTRIIYIIGNHDYNIIYSKIKKKFREYVFKELPINKKRIVFPGFEFKSYQVLFEHGSQLDQFFKVDPKNLIHPKIQTIVEEPFLLFPWGYNALKEHFILIKEEFPILERVFPTNKTLNMLDNQVKKRVILDTFFYMLKSFFFTQFRYKQDKLYNFTWEDFKKYMHNFLKKDYEIKFEDKAEIKLLSSRFKVISYGHNHVSALYKIKGKYILNTNTWRDEYQYSEETKTYNPTKKSYGFIIHDKKKVHDIKLHYVKSKQKSLKPSEIKGLKSSQ